MKQKATVNAEGYAYDTNRAEKLGTESQLGMSIQHNIVIAALTSGLAIPILRFFTLKHEGPPIRHIYV